MSSGRLSAEMMIIDHIHSILILKTFLTILSSFLHITCPYHDNRLPHNFSVTRVTFRRPCVPLNKIYIKKTYICSEKFCRLCCSRKKGDNIHVGNVVLSSLKANYKIMLISIMPPNPSVA